MVSLCRIGRLILGVVLAGIFLRPKSAEAIDSIAVLPLENMTGDPNQEYFVDGMTEALIANLAKISSLRVISRTSIMQYKKARKSLPEIAKELNVAAIVEGSVLRSDGHLRITAQLIDAPKDRHLWANSYDRDLRDVLALQSEVTTAIVREIQVKLTPQEQQRLANTRPVNPDAYHLYLKGRYFENKYANKKGIEYFQKALDVDSTFAPTYTGLARCYTKFGLGGAPYKEVYPKAKAAAIKALELDNTLAAAHAALGVVKFFFEWDWLGPEQHYKQALALTSNSPEILVSYTAYLTLTGRFDEAIVMNKRAIELDPLAPFPIQNLGWSYLEARRYDEAIVQLRLVLELDPNISVARSLLAECYAMKGMYTEAIAECEKLGEKPACAFYYAVSGKRKDALQALTELFEVSKHRYVDSFEISSIYAALGNKDKAFEWLTKAYEEHSTMMVFIKVEPRLEVLRSDPRFVELCKKIGLEN